MHANTLCRAPPQRTPQHHEAKKPIRFPPRGGIWGRCHTPPCEIDQCKSSQLVSAATLVATDAISPAIHSTSQMPDRAAVALAQARWPRYSEANGIPWAHTPTPHGRNHANTTHLSAWQVSNVIICAHAPYKQVHASTRKCFLSVFCLLPRATLCSGVYG